jgi:hypothetical protein
MQVFNIHVSIIIPHIYTVSFIPTVYCIPPPPNTPRPLI